jgi:integrase
MANRKILTDRAVKSLRPAAQGKRYIVADVVVPGLGVRVTDRAHRTYVLGARFPGSKHFKRRELGEVGALTLEEARNKARDWLELIKAGRDPADVERKKRQENRQIASNTFGAVVEDFVVRHLRGKRKAAVVEREVRTELAAWMKSPIAEITRRDVVELIEAIVDRPAHAYARNIFDHIRGVFNFAIARGFYGIEHSPCDRLKPRDLIGVKRVRDRVLSDEELWAVWRATSRPEWTPYPYGPLIRLLMLTGCRLSEVAGARWREFDLERERMWVIPAARYKMNADHRIPLTPDMIALLEALPRWKKGDFLFSMDGAKPYNGFSKSKERLDRRVLRSWRAAGRIRGVDRREHKIEGWSAHDLRRTVRTRLSALRVPEPIAELVIGHARRGLARVYDQHRFEDEKREALTAWNALLKSIVDPPSIENVIELRRDRLENTASRTPSGRVR